MLLDTSHIIVEQVTSDLLNQKKIELMVARLDKLHPVVSGNKIFKLKYFLGDAVNEQQTVVTFGGAYSNHLAATAFACKSLALPCLGIVRGEEPAEMSLTLKSCIADGMELLFVSRSVYQQVSQGSLALPGLPSNALIVPEGGYHPQGAKGAATIMDAIAEYRADAIVAPIGTATTIAGLLRNASPTQEIIAVPVLKNLEDLDLRFRYLNGRSGYANFRCWTDYHFGGYAKKSPELIQFMNELYTEHGLPTDFVYTAKMMFAVMDKIKTGYFAEGSRVLCIHTGGLQGNQSLPTGALVF